MERLIQCKDKMAPLLALLLFSVVLEGCVSSQLDRIEQKRADIAQMTNAQVCQHYNQAMAGDKTQQAWLDFYQVTLTERFRASPTAKNYCLANADAIVERQKSHNRSRWSSEGEEIIRNQNSGYIAPDKM